jgi:hypothetical protein
MGLIDRIGQYRHLYTITNVNATLANQVNINIGCLSNNLPPTNVEREINFDERLAVWKAMQMVSYIRQVIGKLI